MKKALILILSLLLLTQTLANAESGKIILLTEYRQMGWGESYAMGAVDEQGNLWSLTLESWQEIPLSDEDFLNWVPSQSSLELVGTLSSSELFDLKGMVAAVEEMEVTYTSAACDAGYQQSYAYRYDSTGQAEAILLGASGDEVFENTDATAQALYRFLRQTFPEVTSYDDQAGMAPAGFQAVSLMRFSGYEGLNPDGLSLTAWYDDCEAGMSEIAPELTLDDLKRMSVSGKKNCNSVTGDTVVYRLTDAEGNVIARFEFYDGLLVMPDGMYTVQ